MTKDALKVPAWAVPILLSALVAAVVAWAQLGGKEDAAAHDRDMADAKAERTAFKVELQGSITELHNEAALRSVRDSARAADMMRVLLDIQRQVKSR